MPVRKFLDLSTAHLPYDIGCNDGDAPINTIDGVIVYEMAEYGWFMWVPGRGTNVTTMSAHNSSYKIPAEIVAIQEFARSYGCDYVFFDRDGPDEPNLPRWDW